MSGSLTPLLGVAAGGCFLIAASGTLVFLIPGTMLTLWAIDVIVWEATRK